MKVVCQDHEVPQEHQLSPTAMKHLLEAIQDGRGQRVTATGIHTPCIAGLSLYSTTDTDTEGN